jgi:hypothetical protein
MAFTSKRSAQGVEMHQPIRVGRDSLAVVAMAFLAANLLHGIDHERQGTGRLTSEVMIGGAALTLLAIVTLIVVLRRSSRAPLVATVVGFWTAINVGAAHIAPHWSAFSDSYPEIDADTLAWAVMLLEIATAFLLGVVGVHRLRARAPGATDGGTLTDGIEQPAPRRTSTLQG